MDHPDSTVYDLERQRLELEGNLLQLQKSLYHWRLWEAEYDALKDEIAALHDDATLDDFLKAGSEFGGSVVTEDEVKTIVTGGRPGVSRSKQQIVDLISRRIDYVRENVQTMGKRLSVMEETLNNSEMMSWETSQGGKGLPLTEILEELDDEGRIISSSTSTPGDKAPELLKVLEKAGVKDIPGLPKRADVAQSPSPSPSNSDQQAEEKKWNESRTLSEPAKMETTNLGTFIEPSVQSNGTSGGDGAGSPSLSMLQVLDEEVERPVKEVDESPEDARLRREMLQYGLNEVGAVVAELEFDEEASDISFDEYEDELHASDSEEDEEEDEYGRTTRRVLTDKYHQEMRELEKKLNARGMLNIGKNTSSFPEDMRNEIEALRLVKGEKPIETPSTQPPAVKKPKKVAFAKDLDIAPAPTPNAAANEKLNSAPVKQSSIPVVSDSIIERTEPSEDVIAHSELRSAPKRLSLFKGSRQARSPALSEPATASSTRSIISIPNSEIPQSNSSLLRQQDSSNGPGFPVKPQEPAPFVQAIRGSMTENNPLERSELQSPEGKTLADKVVEREISKGHAMPPEADELDEELHRKEIASEFYRVRNRMIYQRGGFVNDEEPETVPVERDDPPKRSVSRLVCPA